MDEKCSKLERELQDLKNENTLMTESTNTQNDQIKQLKSKQGELVNELSRKEKETDEIKTENNQLQRQLKEFKNQNASNLQIINDKR